MLRDNILQSSHAEPVVIVLDWSRAAQTIFVNKAAASTKVTGFLLAIFLWKLQLLQQARYGHMHLIGHSFGAEIASTTGRFVQYLSGGRKIFAITGASCNSI